MHFDPKHPGREAHTVAAQSVHWAPEKDEWGGVFTGVFWEVNQVDRVLIYSRFGYFQNCLESGRKAKLYSFFVLEKFQEQFCF